LKSVDSETLKDIAFKNLNRVPPGRGDDVGSYIHTILVWLAEWAVESQHRTKIPPGYCAFVLEPEQARPDPPKGAKEAHFFKEDKTPLLGGNVYITDYALNKVYRYSGKCRDLNEIAGELAKRELGDRPFVAFDVETQTVYICASGMATRPTPVPLRQDIPDPFDEDAFKAILDDIYRDNLRYAEPYPGLWYDTKERIPCKATELIVQSHICAILKARAQGSGRSTGRWLTISEKKNNAGRIDIAIYLSEHCIVAAEIKVLRFRHYNPDVKKAIKVTPDFNEKWAKRGARQARRYKESEPSDYGVLVLYDMRDKDEDAQGALDDCKRLDVRYLRYYLHNGTPDSN
jgi:hypothetical protein